MILCATSEISFDKVYGTADWCMIGDESMIRGVNVYLVGSDTMDPTGYELAGMYIIVRAVQCITEYYGTNNGTIAIGIDYVNGLKLTFMKNSITTGVFH